MPEQRRADLRYGTPHPFQPVSQPEKSGGAAGWLIEAQQFTSLAWPVVAVRITHPDGRQLDLNLGADEQWVTTSANVGRLLSPQVSYLLRSRRTAAGDAAGVAALARVFDTAWPLSRQGWQGPALLDVVQAAAFDVPMTDVHLWRSTLHHQHLLTDPSERPPALLGVPVTVRLMRSGLSPTQVLAWFGYSDRAWFGYDDLPTVRADVLRKAYLFETAGWTREQASAFIQAQGRLTRIAATDFPDERWARLSFDQALAAVEAGISPDEAVRLLSEGQLDAKALALLASLRRPGAPGVLGLVAA